MGLPFVLGVIGLAWFGGKVVAGATTKKRNLWYGGMSTPVSETEKIWDMYVLDPNQPGKFPVGDGSSTNFAPLAIARVQWDGKTMVTINKNKNPESSKMPVGKIIMIINYEMSPKPSGRPVVGDSVLFD